MLGDALAALTAAGFAIVACRPDRSEIEEAFLALTGDEPVSAVSSRSSPLARALELRKLAAFVRRDFLVAWSYRLSFLTELLGLVAGALVFYFVGLMVDPTRSRPSTATRSATSSSPSSAWRSAASSISGWSESRPRFATSS